MFRHRTKAPDGSLKKFTSKIAEELNKNLFLAKSDAPYLTFLCRNIC